jgi:DNA-binding MarR family transcriptional regulator
MEKIFNILYSNLHNAGYKDKSIFKKFLFSTKQHSILIFFISSQKKRQSTLEEICYNVSAKVISRSTIQNILKEGVSVKFLKKEINSEDKRSKYYTLTDEAKKFMLDWLYKQKKVFSNLNELNNLQ